MATAPDHSDEYPMSDLTERRRALSLGAGGDGFGLEPVVTFFSLMGRTSLVLTPVTPIDLD